MKLGLIGDTHIPKRANKIPEEFLRWFEKERVDLIIHTGDINDPKVLEELKTITEVKAVQGNTDYLDLPRELVLDIEGWKIFVFHSDEVYPRGDLDQIYEYAKAKNARIVIFGHTHLPLFTYYQGVYYVNPGTATGVASGEYPIVTKSVAILELKKDKINVKFNIITI